MAGYIDDAQHHYEQARRCLQVAESCYWDGDDPSRGLAEMSLAAAKTHAAVGSLALSLGMVTQKPDTEGTD